MALIDVECLAPACGHIFEYVRPIAEWPATPPCVKCGSPDTDDAHLPPRTVWSVAPVIVFRAPDGTHRFPGEADGVSARKYAAQGFTRVEIRSATDMRRFERTMNRDEQRRATDAFERSEHQRSRSETARRRALYREMEHMTPLGRDMARAAMAQSDAIRRAPHVVGFHSEIYNVDRSNREDSRDSSGRRRRN